MEKTPTTGQVRDVWEGLDNDNLKSRDAFDRWLNEELARAYDEGQDGVYKDPYTRGMAYMRNPYRKGPK